MKKITVAFVAIFTLAATSANADPGLSIGASAGYVTVAQSDPTFDFDGNDVGYKFFGNYMFNNYFGVEGGYVDFGTPDADTVLGIASIEATGWNLYLVGNLPLGDTFDVPAMVTGPPALIDPPILADPPMVRLLPTLSPPPDWTVLPT